MDSPGNPCSTAASAKQDPAGLVLRGRPRPAIRFRRGLVVAVAAASVSALAALAWAALGPATFVAAGDRPARAAERPSPEGLAGAPESYSDVPQLGPPLPGDLGRAIVDQERGLGAAGGSPDSGNASEARQALASELQAARQSPVLVHLSRTVAHGEEPKAPAVSSTVPGQAAGVGERGAVPEGPGSQWTLVSGTVIPASLLTGLNSDLPGTVVAQVTHDVRDSATGQAVLIPRGARLIGDYESKVGFGQERALVAWKRLVFPDGSSIDLGTIPATDAAGFSGLEDEVDFHEWRLAKGVLLSSLLGIGTELGYAGDDAGLVRALRESAQSNGASAGDAIVSRNLDVRPTLTVRPGWPVRAILRQDLVLEPWSGA